ncbi:class I SAM-dependent methyltransferase [Nonomuraea aurantiaca]|uniref:class I SAM-dependent methyltransferase n=1 Tax=Nonomuraea aurantiaca TaxID=2878562 RepID=UPI001CD9F486|nr:class I SAM-dependent methyltransferase [Nonomuraea aurantiaca]MCA2228703.1 class I SAM-dependent methyltransferase [Nonomuraea aurantiaca]
MRRGSYGFDAPWALAGLFFGAVVQLALVAVSFAFDVPAAGIAFLLGALYTLASAGSYLYTTRRGKFAVWGEELGRIEGDEQVLDLGCGRGMVLLLAARRLRGGRATGIDLWSGKDQSGNAESVTRANAEAEGVSDRVNLVTGDMRELPFEDGRFDLIVSSLAIHNIPTAEGRDQAVKEAHRVLRPGGLMLIADFRHTSCYEDVLRGLGVVDVRRRDLGWRFWYGGPWFKSEMLEARKPGSNGVEARSADGEGAAVPKVGRLHQDAAPVKDVGDGA